MAHNNTIAAQLLQRVVLVGAAATGGSFELDLFRQHCAQHGATADGARVIAMETDIVTLAFAGACVLSRNFDWAPTPL